MSSDWRDETGVANNGDTHVVVGEEEDALVGEDGDGIARDDVDDGQPVNLLLHQHAHGIVQSGPDHSAIGSV